jgi:hypothetical protein
MSSERSRSSSTLGIILSSAVEQPHSERWPGEGPLQQLTDLSKPEPGPRHHLVSCASAHLLVAFALTCVYVTQAERARQPTSALRRATRQVLPELRTDGATCFARRWPDPHGSASVPHPCAGSLSARRLETAHRRQSGARTDQTSVRVFQAARRPSFQEVHPNNYTDS